jgi:hypothetical protein
MLSIKVKLCCSLNNNDSLLLSRHFLDIVKSSEISLRWSLVVSLQRSQINQCVILEKIVENFPYFVYIDCVLNYGSELICRCVERPEVFFPCLLTTDYILGVKQMGLKWIWEKYLCLQIELSVLRNELYSLLRTWFWLIEFERMKPS